MASPQLPPPLPKWVDGYNAKIAFYVPLNKYILTQPDRNPHYFDDERKEWLEIVPKFNIELFFEGWE